MVLPAVVVSGLRGTAWVGGFFTPESVGGGSMRAVVVGGTGRDVAGGSALTGSDVLAGLVVVGVGAGRTRSAVVGGGTAAATGGETAVVTGGMAAVAAGEMTVA